MDSKDFRLLVALYENSRQSLQSLGRGVSLSAPAVRGRLRRLERRGILKGFWTSIDPVVFGREDLLVFFDGDWSREEAQAAALDAPDVAWVAWKLDGGITIETWSRNVDQSLATLAKVLRQTPAGHAIAHGTPRDPLSRLDWRIIEAVIDGPVLSIEDLAASTGLSPKTVRKHLDRMLRTETVSIVPLLGALADAGELVYHIAVFGAAPSAALRGVLGDAFVVHEAQEPPAKYLLCRASNLGEVTTKTHALGKLPGVESFRITLNREMFIGTDFAHGLVRAEISKSALAMPVRS
ncbi:MAG TPA: winged helix-turn-helix transcriptional regulator [Thermoplasmata archaeon]|nr:winged helix-turn-helix transcriptional regulator [Thermoplasmata archaeon]